MSILKHGYMPAVLAELKRDAGKLWVEPKTVAHNGSIIISWKTIEIIISERWLAACYDMESKPNIFSKYTPARFRAALKKMKGRR